MSLLLLILLLILTAANVRAFQFAAFVALFMYPVNGIFAMITILAVLSITIGKHSNVSVAVVTSGLIALYLASLLPFSAHPLPPE